MYPILGRYGPFFLYSYTLVMGVGLLGAVGLAMHRAREFELPWRRPALWILLGALLFGRLGFFGVHNDFFLHEPAARWQLWQGGFHYHSAIIGGAVALTLWCWRWKLPITSILAIFAAPLLWMHAAGWFACYLEGCGYGRLTTIHPLAADLPDTFGVFALRYQTQMVGTALYLILLILFWLLRKRMRPRYQFWVALLTVALVETLLAAWRGDLQTAFGGAPPLLIVNGIFAFLSLLLIQFHYRQGR